MKMHFPNSAFIGNLDPFLRSYYPEEEDRFEITANKNWVSLHPIVFSMAGSIGLTIANKSKINVETLQAKSKHYLERIGLFRLLGVSSGIEVTEHEPAGRFIPLTRISNSAELNTFITEMVPLLHSDPDYAEPIKYVVSELVRNVFEHSKSYEGAVICAQYYKKSNSIKIGISDRGVGIKKTINVSHIASTDLEAIRLALMPGITGTTKSSGGTESNAGAGLFFVKSIAKVNRDFFAIYSGTGFYKLLKENVLKEVKLNVDPFLVDSPIESFKYFFSDFEWLAVAPREWF